MVCLSQNSPYGDIVEGRLREIAQRGADGVYFDNQHDAWDGDWSQWTQARFQATWGGPMPTDRIFMDPQYRKLLLLYDHTLIDRFRQYQQALHGVSADSVAVVSSVYAMAFWDLRMGGEFVGLVQSPKTEWHHPYVYFDRFMEQLQDHAPPVGERPQRDAVMAFLFGLVRDAANGRPPHVWVYNPGRLDEQNAWSYLTDNHLFTSTAALVAHGCIANLHIRPVDSLPLDARYQGPQRMGSLAGQVLAGARPFRWFGIHVNESGKLLRYDQAADLTEGIRAIWDDLLAPAFYSHEALLREGVPVGLVHWRVRVGRGNRDPVGGPGLELERPAGAGNRPGRPDGSFTRRGPGVRPGADQRH
jgi:hypothetical protein